VPEPSVVALDTAHLRVRLLPLLLGRVRVDFGAKVFGGQVSGTLPYGAGSGSVYVEFDRLQLGEVQPLRALVGGLPVLGTVNGELELLPMEGRFAKAEGKLDLKLVNVIVGDGKALLQGVALPAAQIGDIVITGTAKDGLLKIAEISAVGRDLELQGEGKIRIREPWTRSQADIYLRFRFTDAYRDHDDATRGLLGAPDGKFPAAIDYNATVKRAKQEDGFYAWHIHGALSDLAFDPAGAQSRAGRSRLPAGGAASQPVRGTPGARRRGGAASVSDRGNTANAPAGEGVRLTEPPRFAPGPEITPTPPPGAAPEPPPAAEPAAEPKPDDSQPRAPEDQGPTPAGDNPPPE
jgi:type II secretion system protein N